MRAMSKVGVVAFCVMLPLLMAPTGGLPSRPTFQAVRSTGGYTTGANGVPLYASAQILGSTGALQHGRNVSTTTRNSVGNFTANWTVAGGLWNCTASISGSGFGGTGAFVAQISSNVVGSSSVTVNVYDAANHTLADPTGLSIVCVAAA